MSESQSASFPSAPARASLPDWYESLFDAIVERVAHGRLSAAGVVNRELAATYWAIGRLILDRQSDLGWGSAVVERLAIDLRAAFPGARGFSPRNLKYMRAFADAWPDFTMVQRVAQLGWRHHIALLEKLHDGSTRLWHADAAIRHGWSRDMLVHQIDTRLHEREGGAVTNFAATLPPDDSDLAQKMTKDPYIFDFLALTEKRSERELQDQLVKHLQKFLLELGEGFAFVGEQVRLAIGDDEFFADLLFYHLRLRCYVVIELKATGFSPAALGQLGMYIAAVDDLLALPQDKPTIGLLLCKTKNSVVAEYALRSSSAPIGVADWTSLITESLPAELEGSLPSIEIIEAELSREGFE